MGVQPFFMLSKNHLADSNIMIYIEELYHHGLDIMKCQRFGKN